MQHHKYSLTEIENMIPWEREVYLTLLRQHVEEENLKAQQRKIKNRLGIKRKRKTINMAEVHDLP